MTNDERVQEIRERWEHGQLTLADADFLYEQLAAAEAREWFDIDRMDRATEAIKALKAALAEEKAKYDTLHDQRHEEARKADSLARELELSQGFLREEKAQNEKVLERLEAATLDQNSRENMCQENAMLRNDFLELAREWAKELEVETLKQAKQLLKVIAADNEHCDRMVAAEDRAEKYKSERDALAKWCGVMRSCIEKNICGRSCEIVSVPPAMRPHHCPSCDWRDVLTLTPVPAEAKDCPKEGKP